ncbi:MAG: hypothetical protein GY803_02390 [Chloroflexi bacterium]|nr:hypothetical protein [Chloroflexota bacterium]
MSNSGDPLLNSWIMAWDARAFFNDPTHIFDANIFYPHKNTLAYSESQFANALQALPVLWMTQNPILANNFIVLFSFVMSGFGMYLLVKRLTNSVWAGIAAGIIFAFTPYRFTHMRVQLVATHWMPLALLFFDKMIKRKKWTDFLWFGLFYNLTILTSYYYAIFFTVGLAVLGAGYFFADRRQALTKKFLFALGGVVLATAVINIPLAEPYFELAEMGLTRSEELTNQF